MRVLLVVVLTAVAVGCSLTDQPIDLIGVGAAESIDPDLVEVRFAPCNAGVEWKVTENTETRIVIRSLTTSYPARPNMDCVGRSLLEVDGGLGLRRVILEHPDSEFSVIRQP